MKTSLIALTLTLSLSALPVAYAQAQSGQNAKRIFAGLELSETQKQDVKQIMRQTREDKSLFEEDDSLFKQELQAILNSPTWDAQAASTLITERMNSKADARFIYANARHLAYNVLTAEQQTALKEKQDKRAANKTERASEHKNSNRNKSKRDNKKRGYNKGLNIKRLEKRLELSREQVIAIQQIRENQARIQAAVAKAYQRYQILSVLDDTQKAKLKKLMNKARNKKVRLKS